MFKHIIISLTEPLCPCDTMDLAWGIRREDSGKAGLHLRCKTCGVDMNIPHKRFVGRFSFDKPYPGTSKKEEGSKLEVLDGGKILKFEDPEESEPEKKEDEDVP